MRARQGFKQTVVNYFTVLSPYISGETEENHFTHFIFLKHKWLQGV